MAHVDRVTPAFSGKLSLVLPAHNEIDNLELVVTEAVDFLPTLLEDYEVIIVDDGSSDGTRELSDRLADSDPHVAVVHHPVNRGYGAALTSGFRAATGDAIMFMDADRQFAIADLDRLLPFVPTHDIVAGFRMERQDEFHRRAFAEIFNVSIRVLFGVHMRDIDCAFKIFRADLLRSMELTSPGALINTEIQAKARREGASIQQVGVRHFPRVAGESSGGSLKVVTRAMAETIRLWWRMRSYRPVAPTAFAQERTRAGDAAIYAGLAAIAAGVASALKRRGK